MSLVWLHSNGTDLSLPLPPFFRGTEERVEVSEEGGDLD